MQKMIIFNETLISESKKSNINNHIKLYLDSSLQECSKKKINSICKFEFVDSVKSKNINQENVDQKLELITMDYLKNNNNYEISLIFTNNAYITLSTEIIEVTLDDQNKID